MPSRRSRYYLGRVIKHGATDQVGYINAMMARKVYTFGKFNWAITDIKTPEGENAKMPSWIFGRLSKYRTAGVDKVDTEENRTVEERVENMSEASSPFVYIPQHSGISFMPIWNGIKEYEFIERFRKIIEMSYPKTYGSAEIQPITEIKTFSQKVSSMSKINELRAKVHPTNPLFHPLWESLDEFLKGRKTEEMNVSEESEGEIDTNIKQLLEATPVVHPDVPKPVVGITEAAILMATAGYGEGVVSGEIDGIPETASTRDSRVSFTYDKDPDPERLASVVRSKLEQINAERGLRH